LPKSLVQKSIAYPYPYMGFQKSTDINMDIHEFWILVSIYPYKCGYPHSFPSKDIHARTFCNGYPYTTNIHEWISIFLWISVFHYPGFYGFPFGYPWIFMDPLASTCCGFSIQEYNLLGCKSLTRDDERLNQGGSKSRL